MKGRIAYLDNLKSFAILLVVLGHCIQTSFFEDYDNNLLFRYIYSFHMPLFMCVSGWLSYKTDIRLTRILHRFMQLMIPYFAWGLISACVIGGFSWDLFLHPDRAGLWFLWALFFIYAIQVIVEFVSKKIGVKSEILSAAVAMALSAIMIVLKIKLFGFQFIAWYYLFFCMGYYGNKYRSILRIWSNKVQWPFFVLFLISAYFWMRKDPPTFMDAGSGMIYNYIYKFVVAVIALISLFSLFRNYVNHRIRFMTTLGTYTLGIYAVHQPIMHLIADNLYPLSESPLPSALYAAALFVVLMAISVSLCILLSRNKYINGLLLGKWKY